MHTHYMTLLFSFLLSFATAVSSDQTGSGCKLATDFLSAETGFVATVYSNTYNFTNYSIPKSYFYYNYKTESEYGVVNGITQPGITIIDFQGYFEGYQQAYYLDVMLWIGTSNAFDCCNPDEFPKNSFDGSDDSNPGNLLYSDDYSEVFTGYTYLEAGIYYPFRIVVINFWWYTYFSLFFQIPSSSDWSNNWGDYIVSIDDIEEGLCIREDDSFPSTTTILTAATDLTTMTTSYYEYISTDATYTGVHLVAYLDYPAPSTTILTTTSYFGTEYSTISYSFSIDDTTTTPIAYNYYYSALPTSATHTYAYTGTFSGTTTLTYTVNVDDFDATITDIADLVPEGSTDITWTETTSSTSYLTTTAVNAHGAPQLTTITYDYDLISATNSYAYTGVSVVSLTLIYSVTNGNSTYLTTDVAVLYPEGSAVVT
ncbi:hypothetical protein C6P40_002194 [Pichia californica]|uniref:PA14 domain-containing protein n=1 Tax=Pichia californica TaxID=460514 RepID=A0A9P7BFR6_9ASCO|nr:hypothetical protein C6P40_002194 [[Candida] californica]